MWMLRPRLRRTVTGGLLAGAWALLWLAAAASAGSGPVGAAATGGGTIDPGAGSVAATGARATGAGAADDDRWPWPLAPTPTLVAPFDPPESDYGPGHRGIDLAGSPGQPVTAATPGRVSFAGDVAGRGVVVVRYGGLRLTYEPVAPAISAGDVVVTGVVLGWLSATGSHCLPRACLHVGLRAGDTYLDPLPRFGPRPVRLKPLAPADAASSSSGRPSGRPGGAPVDVAPVGHAVTGSREESPPPSALRLVAGVGATLVVGLLIGSAVRGRSHARG
jgi:murein DD-endopeptidase MepM/ murein hydrolase activator NlpD